MFASLLTFWSTAALPRHPPQGARNSSHSTARSPAPAPLSTGAQECYGRNSACTACGSAAAVTRRSRLPPPTHAALAWSTCRCSRCLCRWSGTCCLPIHLPHVMSVSAAALRLAQGLQRALPPWPSASPAFTAAVAAAACSTRPRLGAPAEWWRGKHTTCTFDNTDSALLLEERRREHVRRHTVTADEALAVSSLLRRD